MVFSIILLSSMFSIGFTKRQANSNKANCYANSAQVRRIRAKMIEIMTAEASKVPLRELVKRFITEAIGKEIEKQTKGIYPMKDCFIRKVKMIKKPKFDLLKLMELHGTTEADAGASISRDVVPEAESAVNPLSKQEA